MYSCIYRGTVCHQRFKPRGHRFSYPLYMLYLDLSELEQVFRGRLGWSMHWPSLNWYRRKDHLGPADKELDVAVREFVQADTGIFPRGPIRVLTQLRQLGFLMNPVAFYFIYAPDSEDLEFVLAQVNNTPWNEEHTYLLTADMWDQENPGRPLTEKEFHVSPFMPMDLQYRWRLAPPDDQLAVQMELSREGERSLDVELMMQRLPLTRGNLLRMKCRFPWMTLSIFRRIYWQAFLLWRKKMPFYSHPRKQQTVDRVARGSSQ